MSPSEHKQSAWFPRVVFQFLPILLVAYLGYMMSATKFRMFTHQSEFDAKDETGLFWTESAFHYRYAKMCAEGLPLPEVDKKMQHPEGMHLFRDETPMMERVAGYLYRRSVHQTKAFHVYLGALVAIYSTCLLMPAFWISSRTWGSTWAGLATCLLYAFTVPFFGSITLGGYVRQDFALPFLLMGTGFYLAAIDRRSWITAVLASAFLCFSFMSWHMAQFYYSVMTVGVLLIYFLKKDARDNIGFTVAVVTGLLLLWSLVPGPLLWNAFGLSPAILLGCVLAVQHYTFMKRPVSAKVRILSFVACALIVVGLPLLLRGAHVAKYSHVYQLILDKIRFLGIAPDDPSRMTFESRVMWSSSFLSPSFREVVDFAGPAWIAGLMGIVIAGWRLWKRVLSASGILLLWLIAAFLVLFLMMKRMDIFFYFLLCVFIGALVPRRLFSARGLISTVLIVGLAGWTVWRIQQAYFMTSKPKVSQVKPLYEAIRKYTQPDDVILARFALSPAICAFTDRAVVLHSKFENERVREKVKEYYAALYGSEEDLYSFCRRYGVTYVVHDPNMVLAIDPGSMRYVADRVKMGRDTAAFMMQFKPDALRRFGLVYETPSFRVFRVLQVAAMAGVPIPPVSPPAYRIDQFNLADLGIN